MTTSKYSVPGCVAFGPGGSFAPDKRAEMPVAFRRVCHMNKAHTSAIECHLVQSGYLAPDLGNYPKYSIHV